MITQTPGPELRHPNPPMASTVGGPLKIEVDSVELVPFASITAADIRRSGERDRESLRQRAAHAGPIADDTLLYRVEFHLVESQAR
jgi:hypothetical protein